MRWDRRKKPEGRAIPFLIPAVGDDVIAQAIEKRVEDMRTDAYRRGFTDAVVITLSLLLGEEAEGATPYAGPLPEGLRAWALEARERAAA